MVVRIVPEGQPQIRIAENGCWEWIGGKSDTGYGSFSGPGLPTTQAHRIAYRVLVGPIPDGMFVHHKCRNRPCVNPWHLQLLTNAEHGELHSAEREVSPTCPRGHSEWTSKRGGRWRVCAVCHREEERERRKRLADSARQAL